MEDRVDKCVKTKKTDVLMNGYRALDITDEKGFICGQILATFGVEVIKIEKPGGDPSRKIPPYYHDIHDPEKSLYWFAFNTNKRSITINLETKTGQDLFKRFAANADFILESSDPGYLESLGLDYFALSHINRRIIFTSITHFGQKGPYSKYKGCELIDAAMSGVMDNTGYSDGTPVKEAFGSIYYHANVAAALGTLMSHFYRENTGEGQQVDISIQEVAASRTTLCLLPWQWDKRLVKRGGPMGQIGFRPFRWVWPCKDGHIFWFFLGGQIGAPANAALSRWIDECSLENPLSHVTNWQELDMGSIPDETLEAFQNSIAKFFMKYTKKEIAEESLKRGINAVLVSDPVDVLKNHHLGRRNFWVELEHTNLGPSLNYPRHFFQSNETKNFIKDPAPSIGRDNESIYRDELGLSIKEIAEYRKANII